MKYIFGWVGILLIISCTQKPIATVSIDERVLIPLPQKVIPTENAFLIQESTTIYTDTDSEVFQISQAFKRQLARSSGMNLQVEEIQTNDLSNEDGIYFVLDTDSIQSHDEHYELTTTTERVELKSNTPKGLYRGMQTLVQLLPDEIVKSSVTDSIIWALPGVYISDSPEFEYRGAMLDVARHFFSVEDVKRYIDLISSYKLNTLHLHLADDQGWRIEIKSWPKLTGIGGSSEVGGGEGGFYTQEQYKAIVSYASERFITVIPEIDMPGHTNAALASYPELNCDGKAPKLYTGMRVGFSSLCVDKALTYTFIDDVIREVASMTPGNYIHIGGDESHSTEKDDYITFINKAQEIVKKHGKYTMGWEDIQSATLSDNTIIQHWTSAKNAISGARQGAKVVLSPAKRTYLDMKYTKETKLGLTWAGYVEVDSAYVWNPKLLLDSIPQSQILGIESPLWSETISTIDELEYLAFPRIIGHAELSWSSWDILDWNSYKERLQRHANRLQLNNVNYYASNKVFKDSTVPD